MDFAMLDTPTPTSATWDPAVRRCRNALGRFTGPPKNAAAAAKMLTDLGYTVTIQQGRARYRLLFPGGGFATTATPAHLVRFAERQYERRMRS
jgi:hypothetical protein